MSVKTAVTERLALIVTVHERVPLHAPDQPSNFEPAAAVVVRVRVVPGSYCAEQVAPQSIPFQ
jgi:hypothetical protein